jgi:hypothetical protein
VRRVQWAFFCTGFILGVFAATSVGLYLNRGLGPFTVLKSWTGSRFTAFKESIKNRVLVLPPN